MSPSDTPPPEPPKKDGTAPKDGATPKDASPKDAAHPRKHHPGEHLRHFNKLNQDDYSTSKASSIDKMEHSFRDAKKSVHDKAAAVQHAFTKGKKALIIGVSLLVVVVLVIVVAPTIPLQIQRSSGYAAVEAGNYEEGFNVLTDYLIKRPNDHQAKYQTAVAALQLGDIPYAVRTLNQLYNDNSLPNEKLLPYHHALANINHTDIAIASLDRQLSANPGHLSGHLLRGVLLMRKEGSLRKSREDFLKVDKIIRAAPEELSDILSLHNYLQTHDALPIFVDAKLPALSPNLDGRHYNALGFNTGYDGYYPDYRLSNGASYIDEPVGADIIAPLYFSYMLMAQGELQEASTELRGLLSSSPDVAAVRQASALLNAFQGNNLAAAKDFTVLAEKNPDDVQTLNNLAVARFLSAIETGSGDINNTQLADIIGLYDDVLALEADNSVALNNSAFLRILGEDDEKADALLADVSDDKLLPYSRLNRAIIALHRQQPNAALTLLADVSPQQLSQVQDYQIAAYLKNSNTEKITEMLNEMAEANPDDQKVLLLQAKITEKAGIQHLALMNYQEFLAASPDDAEVHYRIAALALQLDNTAVFNKHNTALLHRQKDDDSVRHFLAALSARMHEKEGAVDDALLAYKTAIDETTDIAYRQEHALAWTRLQLANGAEPAVITEELTALLDDYFSAPLAAILAFLIADSESATALQLAQQAKNDRSFVVQKYAGGAFAKVGDYDEALPLLLTAREWLPTDLETIDLLIDALQKNGDKDAAADLEITRQNLRESLTVRVAPPNYQVEAPDNDDLKRAIRDSLESGGDAGRQAVLKGYDDLLDGGELAEKERADLLHSRATYKIYLQQYRSAVADFEGAISSGLLDEEKQINALLFYARVLSQLEDYAKQESVLSHLLTLRDTLIYRSLHARAVLATRQTENAVFAYEEILKYYPHHLSSYYELAEILEDNLDRTKAEKILKLLVRMEPGYVPAYKLLFEINSAKGNKKLARQYSQIYALLAR